MEARVVVVNATELKPGAKYVLAIDKSSLTMHDLELLQKELRRMGVENTVALLTNGDPSTVMKIIEQEPTDVSSNSLS